MANLDAKIIEDNGGGLTLYVLDETNTCIYAHSGYEYTPGELSKDLHVLLEQGDVSGWEENEEELVEGWDRLDIDGIGRQLIADTSGGILFVYPNDMGAAGKLEFGWKIREEECRNASRTMSQEECQREPILAILNGYAEKNGQWVKA